MPESVTLPPIESIAGPHHSSIYECGIPVSSCCIGKHTWQTSNQLCDPLILRNELDLSTEWIFVLSSSYALKQFLDG